MNLDDLRGVQASERSTDSLQSLPDSFYRDVADYIEGLREERSRAAERAEDPFGSEEVRRLTDEIDTAEEVAEAIYDRRIGKVVKRASLAAAGMPADEEGLTDEEARLFSDLVGQIESHRDAVLAAFAGEASMEDAGSGGVGETGGSRGARETAGSGGGTEASAPAGDSAASAGESAAPTESAGDRVDPDPDSGFTFDSEPESDPAPPTDAEAGAGSGESALDAGAAMGGDDGSAARGDDSLPPSEGAPESGGDSTAEAEEPDLHDSTDPDPAGKPDLHREEGSAPTDEGEIGRTTVRITRDVGEIMGVDEHVYTLTEEDVVTLPRANAEPLIDRDAASRIE